MKNEKPNSKFKIQKKTQKQIKKTLIDKFVIMSPSWVEAQISVEKHKNNQSTFIL